ncbi:MAG TPA: asparagine synthase-related protein [Cyclobacteriaceae bacterium]
MRKVVCGTRVIADLDGVSIGSNGQAAFGCVTDAPGAFTLFTQPPMLSNHNRHGSNTQLINSPDDLKRLQNEVSGMVISWENDSLSFLGFSARISRSRVYFLIRAHSLLLSTDLRELLPYSKRKLNREIAYGIVKFGEAPEYHTIVDDIFCIPGGCSLNMDMDRLRQAISAGDIPESAFIPYFHIPYTLTGGDEARTEALLMEVLTLISPHNPALLVSGGVDSTLLNFLYDKVVDRPYQAIFLNFKNAPDEYEYARQSIRNTKAEWMPVDVHNESFLNDFKESIARLIHPVYDNGSVFVGHQLMKHLRPGQESTLSFIDGTLADSCYGVRNYNVRFVEGKYQPEVYSLLKEWLYVAATYFGIRFGGKRPRDAFLHDEFLQDLLWYGGPFINAFFRNSRKYTRSLKEKYYHYVDFLYPEDRSKYWPVYTIIKLMLYAGKQTTVKTYDALLPHHVYYPFMFPSILEDQGRYDWDEKSKGGVIKVPLKRILEKYIDSSFIYRRKSGLRSPTRRWLLLPEARAFVIDLLVRKGGVAEAMMGVRRHWLIKQLQGSDPLPQVVSIALSLSVIQYWCDLYKIEDFS